jgi:hypothetical protein
MKVSAAPAFGFVDQNTCAVIPGCRTSGEPGMKNHLAARIAVWIPGSREYRNDRSASRKNEEDRSEMP